MKKIIFVIFTVIMVLTSLNVSAETMTEDEFLNSEEQCYEISE